MERFGWNILQDFSDLVKHALLIMEKMNQDLEKQFVLFQENLGLLKTCLGEILTSDKYVESLHST